MFQLTTSYLTLTVSHLLNNHVKDSFYRCGKDVTLLQGSVIGMDQAKKT